jgi:hypothetical protein
MPVFTKLLTIDAGNDQTRPMRRNRNCIILLKLDPVGCEVVFKPLLGVDTNYGSVFPSDSRPGERSCGR